MARSRKHKPDKTPAPQKSATEHLHEKSKQSGPDSMKAAPESRQEATEAAVYSTGPGEVVAYDYRRTGTYADVYNEQQTTDVAGQVSSGSAGNPT